MVGFSSSTADSRIRKYEGDLMAPKSEIRNKLVQALDVDPSALSDIDIHSIEDVVRTFFLWKNTLGLKLNLLILINFPYLTKKRLTTLNGIFLLSTAICISGMN